MDKKIVCFQYRWVSGKVEFFEAQYVIDGLTLYSFENNQITNMAYPICAWKIKIKK
jgi:hypothetical protein